MSNLLSPKQSEAKRPTLNEFLSEHGVSDDICTKLVDQDIGWDELLWLEADDLDILCGKDQLNLPFKQKLKFKTAIKTLQSLYKLKEKSFIAITMREQSSLDKVKIELKNAQNVQILFENHFIEIDDHLQKLKLKVDKELDDIMKKVKERKQCLYKKIEEWKLHKLESVNKEICDITKYQQELIFTKKKCKEMLKIDYDDRNRENKINEITQKLYEKHMKYKDFLEFIENNTKLMQIKFLPETTTINKLNEYGEIMINGSKSLCSIAEIKLIEVVKTNEFDDGYKIKIKWETFGKLSYTNNNFIIKYMDDEKKRCQINEFENEFDEWNVMNYKQVKYEVDGNKYEVDTETILKFNKTYMYKVSLLTEYPISVLLESNIIKLAIKYGGPPINIATVIKIPLKLHSHRKHDKDNDPSNMLIYDDKRRYYSATNNHFNFGETDWIIFMINDDNLYFPTKFIIKNWEYTNGIEKMIIQIGDGHNEWFTFNSNKVFHVKKGSVYHNKYQQFSITGIGSNLIRSNKFTHIKIKFLKNHGNHFPKNHRFIVYEFQLHGIMLQQL